MRRHETRELCPKCGGEVIRLVGGDYNVVVVLDAQPAITGNYTIVHLESGTTLAQQDDEMQWDLFGECDGKKYQLHRLVCPSES